MKFEDIVVDEVIISTEKDYDECNESNGVRFGYRSFMFYMIEKVLGDKYSGVVEFRMDWNLNILEMKRCKLYFRGGKLHNINGLAWIWNDGSEMKNLYYLDDIRIDKKVYNKTLYERGYISEEELIMREI